MKIKLVLLICRIAGAAKAQETMQFYRPFTQNGVNVFETSKVDTIPFTGLKVKVGGNFEMEF